MQQRHIKRTILIIFEARLSHEIENLKKAAIREKMSDIYRKIS